MTQNGVPVAEGLKILDFGLAKIKSGELLGSFVQAKTSGLMGSPFYMAPEQWSDDEPDSRADIYSLGIILYQMLSGDVPFKGSSIPSIMKKHLTLPPPSFQSLGVQVPPQIEAVVRHALEKEPDARIPSIEVFLRELREAVSSAPATVRAPRKTGALDPNQTVMSHVSSDTTPRLDPTSYSETAFDPLAGTVSSAALGAEVHQEIADAQREQEQREIAAREEIAREAEARRQHEAAEARKRKEEEERLLKEKEEREARERQQRDQMERVERQAKELEDRLARLATSMPPPQVAVIDPEVTQMHQAVKTQAMGNNSFPGIEAVQQSERVFAAPGTGKQTPVLLISIALVVLLIAGGVVVG
ncbi:MAG: serine/threonine-protein kinase, partial [Gammaproteobacteria bacterium]